MMEWMLEIEDLSVGYSAPIINDISFRVKHGEIVAILGRNGSGKSTLLGGISGAQKVYQGQIMVNGISMKEQNIRKRASYISLLSQKTPRMAGLLVEQVIGMGCYQKHGLFLLQVQEKRKTIERCAELFGIKNLLEKECHKLSEGQRGLVFLAKLVAQNTPVILLDEPDSALDYMNTHHFFEVVKKLVRTQNKAAMIVLHNPVMALKWCDRIMILDNGRLIENLDLKKIEITEIQRGLQKIYPQIKVMQDRDGIYYCDVK